jgi:hypothetical protein
MIKRTCGSIYAFGIASLMTPAVALALMGDRALAVEMPKYFHRFQERRRLAAECLARARQVSDATVRASLLGMAQKYLELANDQNGTRTLSDILREFNEQQLLAAD